MITTLAELSPEARAVVEEYLAAVAPTIVAKSTIAQYLRTAATYSRSRFILLRSGNGSSAGAEKVKGFRGQPLRRGAVRRAASMVVVSDLCVTPSSPPPSKEDHQTPPEQRRLNDEGYA